MHCVRVCRSCFHQPQGPVELCTQEFARRESRLSAAEMQQLAKVVVKDRSRLGLAKSATTPCTLVMRHAARKLALQLHRSPTSPASTATASSSTSSSSSTTCTSTSPSAVSLALLSDRLVRSSLLLSSSPSALHESPAPAPAAPPPTTTTGQCMARACKASQRVNILPELQTAASRPRR